MAGHTPGFIYILHLEQPIENSHSPKRHYIGWTTDPNRRILVEHLEGNHEASRFMAEVKRQGIKFVVGNIFPGTPSQESRIKRRHNHKRLCRVCIGA